MSKHDKILVILGPTSSGKSDIAIKLAKKFNGEIISADSRQIYRGMDIGTGKVERDRKSREIPSAVEGSRDKKLSFIELQVKMSKEKTLALNERKVFMSSGILHHMIDIVSPRTDYNVAKFKKEAEKIIRDILRRNKLPIICGGTGFWIQAIVDNVNFPEVKPSWRLRKKLEKYSAIKLFIMLQKLDPARASNIDAKNKVRLIRAIEISKVLGKVPPMNYAAFGEPRLQWESGIMNYEFLQLGIVLPKEKLHKNIEKRVKQRFKQGMIAEVKKLHQQGLSWKKIQSFGLAYFWIPFYLQKNISKAELVEKVLHAEKNYAKRQMTWFRRNQKIVWLDNIREIKNATKQYLSQ